MHCIDAGIRPQALLVQVACCDLFVCLFDSVKMAKLIEMPLEGAESWAQEDGQSLLFRFAGLTLPYPLVSPHFLCSP